MKKYIFIVLVLALVASVLYYFNQTEVGEIIVESPASSEEVSSPLVLKGQARGFWYFEASAPVKVLDESGKVLGTSYITAQGEWMTEELVPFLGTIEFATPETKTGFVVFMNDNPSGDPARDKELRVPVVFK